MKLFSLAWLLCAVAPLQADELWYWHHAWTGMAIVAESPQKAFTAALRSEDFDPGHDPRILNLKTLVRIYLTPSRPLPATMAETDTRELVHLKCTAAGHAIINWPGWAIEQIPVDEINRQENASYAALPEQAAEVRVLIRQLRDSVLIVLIAER
jgi:hypothetical protein